MKIASLSLAFLSVFLLPSCVELDGGGGYYSSGRSYGPVYETEDYGYGYSRPYGTSHYSQPHNGGRNYNGNGRPDYSHSNDHRSSNNNNGRREEAHEKIKLTGGNDGSHDTRPSGFHTADWYQHRGYDLHKYNYKDEDGDVKHKAHSSSSSDKDKKRR